MNYTPKSKSIPCLLFKYCFDPLRFAYSCFAYFHTVFITLGEGECQSESAASYLLTHETPSDRGQKTWRVTKDKETRHCMYAFMCNAFRNKCWYWENELLFSPSHSQLVSFSDHIFQHARKFTPVHNYLVHFIFKCTSVGVNNVPV